MTGELHGKHWGRAHQGSGLNYVEDPLIFQTGNTLYILEQFLLLKSRGWISQVLLPWFCKTKKLKFQRLISISTSHLYVSL